MNNLLEIALNAHGGLDRWEQFNRVQATVTADGALWHLKGAPNLLNDYNFEINTREQHVLFNRFSEQDIRSLYTTDDVSIERISTGEAILSLENPRASFNGHVLETMWEKPQVVYFASYAMWLYLTQPFLYTYPGFVTEEIEPWTENGETWRRLKIIFPDHVATHSREQVSYFGEDGLLRRHDYTVDVIDNAAAANYASDYEQINGILVPTKRRVYIKGEDGYAVKEPLLVSIDMKDISFS